MAVFRFLLVALAAVLVPTVSLAHGPSGQAASAEARAARAAARGAAEQLTVEMSKKNGHYHAAHPSGRAGLERDLVTMATSRKQALLSLIEDEPGAVLRLAMPAKVRASLPPAVRSLVEDDADEEGELEVLHEDHPVGGRYLYRLKTQLEKLSLHFAADPPALVTGSRVRVKGKRLQQALALESGTSSVEALVQALPNTFGAQRTIVILVNFQNNPVQPYTVDQARSVVFGTTSSWDMENSYGQTWLTGDVAGWYTIPIDSTACNYSSIATHARQAATAAGVSLSNYRRYVYAFPSNACGWWGLGTVGGNPSQAWINGSLQLRVVAHEMGHNLGLYHSHSFECGTSVLGTSCSVIDYGDTLDVMGSSSGHFNAFQKERLGWLDYGMSPPITTVTASGTFPLEPYAAQTDGAKALKILKSTDPATGMRTYYYIEYRQAIGFDGFLSGNANVLNGVVVRTGSEASGNTSDLLDMTPTTSSWSDPALTVGRSFHDPDAGVTITPLWANATGAGVDIGLGAQSCVRGVPTLTVSPSQGPWVQAGAPVAYTLSLANTDNAGCAPSTFGLQATVPAGWTSTFGAPSLALAPGQTASTTVTVSSASSTTEGFHSLGFATADAATAAHAASTPATYVVMSSLSLAVSTDRSIYDRGQTVTITTSVRASGAAVANASVSVKITKPGGAVVTQTAVTNANGVAVVKLRTRKQDPRGLYQVLSQATLNGAIAGQAAASFTLQ